jgi:predicted nucleic-acid-binding protein
MNFLRVGVKMAEVVDTNIILRFLVGDNLTQQKQAQSWFKKAEQGDKKLVIHPIVVAECCFVLESFYKKNREEISLAFETFLSQKWLKVENRKALLLMWDDYKDNLHFVDSFLISFAKNNEYKVLSFDKKLLKSV